MIIIPVPPSANAMYRPAKGRHIVKSQVYKDWLEAHKYEVRARFKPVSEKVPVRVSLIVNVGRQRDLDNLVKPICDLLQYSGVLPDDRWVDEITMNRVDDAYDYYISKNRVQVHLAVL